MNEIKFSMEGWDPKILGKSFIIISRDRKRLLEWFPFQYIKTLEAFLFLSLSEVLCFEISKKHQAVSIHIYPWTVYFLNLNTKFKLYNPILFSGIIFLFFTVTLILHHRIRMCIFILQICMYLFANFKAK